eukprot:jgi/Botrbrau1/16264/Bobra.0066s0048.1
MRKERKQSLNTKTLMRKLFNLKQSAHIPEKINPHSKGDSYEDENISAINCNSAKEELMFKGDGQTASEEDRLQETPTSLTSFGKQDKRYMTPSGKGQSSTGSTSRVTTPPTPSLKTQEHLQCSITMASLLLGGHGAPEQVEEVEKELVEEEQYMDEMCVKATQTHMPTSVEDGMAAWLQTEEYLQDVQAALSLPVPQRSAGPPHHLNILVAGERGLGKTTFIRNLAACAVERKGESAPEQHLEVEMEGEPEPTSWSVFESCPSSLETTLCLATNTNGSFFVTFQDTPGHMEGEVCQAVLREVEARRAVHFQMEQDPQRSMPLHLLPDRRIDLVLYFVPPHVLRPMTVDFIACLSELAPVLPIIAKADCMDLSERNRFRAQIWHSLSTMGCNLHQFDSQAAAAAGFPHKEHVFAVVASPYVDVSMGRFWPVREMPWGRIETMYRAHTDVSALKQLLLGSSYMTLKRSTEERYMQYRRTLLLGEPSPDKWGSLGPPGDPSETDFSDFEEAASTPTYHRDPDGAGPGVLALTRSRGHRGSGRPRETPQSGPAVDPPPIACPNAHVLSPAQATHQMYTASGITYLTAHTQGWAQCAADSGTHVKPGTQRNESRARRNKASMTLPQDACASCTATPSSAYCTAGDPSVDAYPTRGCKNTADQSGSSHTSAVSTPSSAKGWWM